MPKNVFALAVALSVLTNSPSVAVAAEPASVPASGTWTDVTPNGVDLVNMLSCENYGSTTMVSDPARPSDLFTQFHCQGVWPADLLHDPLERTPPARTRVKSFWANS
jgi:hypothetical protein